MRTRTEIEAQVKKLLETKGMEAEEQAIKEAVLIALELLLDFRDIIARLKSSLIQ